VRWAWIAVGIVCLIGIALHFLLPLIPREQPHYEFVAKLHGEPIENPLPEGWSTGKKGSEFYGFRCTLAKVRQMANQEAPGFQPVDHRRIDIYSASAAKGRQKCHALLGKTCAKGVFLHRRTCTVSSWSGTLRVAHFCASGRWLTCSALISLQSCGFHGHSVAKRQMITRIGYATTSEVRRV
jgi:hypothetical protein